MKQAIHRLALSTQFHINVAAKLILTRKKSPKINCVSSLSPTFYYLTSSFVYNFPLISTNFTFTFAQFLYNAQVWNAMRMQRDFALVFSTDNVAFQIIKVDVSPSTTAAVNQPDLCAFTIKFNDIPGLPVHCLGAFTSCRSSHLKRD